MFNFNIRTSACGPTRSYCVFSDCAYLVVDAVEVGMETLMEPPAGVADLGTDVSGVRCAEDMPVVVPAERILHRSTETRHVEAVPVLLVLYPAGGGEPVKI